MYGVNLCLFMPSAFAGICVFGSSSVRNVVKCRPGTCRFRTGTLVPVRTLTYCKRYGHAQIRSDASTPCIDVPAVYIIRPGRSLRERGLYAMGGTLHPRL